MIWTVGFSIMTGLAEWRSRRNVRPPIVMFTGLGYDEDAMQAARKAGANGYVSKGLGPSEIYSALMRVLQHQPVKA